MKKIFSFFAATLVAFAAGAAEVNDTITYRIDGMHCDHCAHKVRKLLRENAGVGQVSVDLERHTATIAYDASVISADSIQAKLAATKRYAPASYSKDDVIYNKIGLRIDDMFCGRCATRITDRLSEMAGVDSIVPHVGKHYVTIKYDANKIHKADIRQALAEQGFTPVNYYENPKASYAYFNIPKENATQETLDAVLALDGVEDVFTNGKRGSLALTYVNTETTEEKLLEQIQAEGIAATVPPAHQCKEESEE